jgi:polyribonucleotide nucleotidyltransferase
MNSKNPIPSKGLETEIAGEKLVIQTGNWAYQADGAVTVSYGDTVVLATAVMSKTPREGVDFLPLLVDYEERLYAAGKISSSRFIKREGRPSENAILVGRLVDRSFRPLFPKNIRNDIQIVLTVLSVDGKNDPDIASIIAASTALSISSIPWQGPVGACRVGMVDGKLVLNPSYEVRTKSTLDLVVSGTANAICMVEAGSSEISEQDMVEAISFTHKHIKKIVALEQEISQKIATKKEELPQEDDNDLIEKIEKNIGDKLDKAIFTDKLERDKKLAEIKDTLFKELEKSKKENEEIPSTKIEYIFAEQIKEKIRQKILKEEKRADGRSLDEIRPIKCQVKVLPRTHGSGLFTRGYTQVLSILTLGSSGAEQTIEGIEPKDNKRFMHHYNFPSFSVGEVSPMRSTSRREIGHGALAEKALSPVIPDKEKFPYTIRLVSEVLSSDGSTSMGSVCGSTLSLMDAGVPIKKPVAGAAMGLVKDGNNYKILTDIAGIEDACGDMDFKVAGTSNGITALQMDIKVLGISESILKDALDKALKARLFILDKITKEIATPRKELSPYAPRIITLKVNPDKVRDIIGPGGKTINKIVEETGVEIDIEPDGIVRICSADSSQSKKATDWIADLTREAKAGEIYQGKVTRIMDFGAFVEIFPGAEGLVHISQLDNKRVDKVEDVVKVGDTISVMVTEIDKQGRINLSHKAIKNKR